MTLWIPRDVKGTAESPVVCVLRFPFSCADITLWVISRRNIADFVYFHSFPKTLSQQLITLHGPEAHDLQSLAESLAKKYAFASWPHCAGSRFFKAVIGMSDRGRIMLTCSWIVHFCGPWMFSVDIVVLFRDASVIIT